LAKFNEPNLWLNKLPTHTHIQTNTLTRTHTHTHCESVTRRSAQKE